MKRAVTMMMLCLLTVVATAQTSKEARQWLKKSEWSALKKAKPHKTLNVDEFCRQYQKNKEQWDVALRDRSDGYPRRQAPHSRLYAGGQCGGLGERTS